MSYKLCIDIGGSKIISGLLGPNGNIVKSQMIDTPKNIVAFERELKLLAKNFSNGAQRLNISFAGRVDASGKVLLAPNLPKALIGRNIKKLFNTKSEKTTIENDGTCFALNNIRLGNLKSGKSGLCIVWGTGIGGAIIFFDKVVRIRGRDMFGEIGHIQYLDHNYDVEKIIGGKNLESNFGHDGKELYALAYAEDKEARDILRGIGRIFGRYLLSLIFIFDPEVVCLGGGIVNLWKFIKPGVDEIKRLNSSAFGGIKEIYVSDDPYAMLKGAYFADERENFTDKL